MNRFINKILLLAVVSLSAWGCEGTCPPIEMSTTTIYIENESSHDIVILNHVVAIACGLPETYSVDANSTYRFVHHYESSGFFGDTYFVPMESVITFDGSVSITHRHVDGSVYHNFSHEECFDVISRKKFEQTVSFTFTDADYDYAVSRQTEIPVAYESLYK